MALPHSADTSRDDSSATGFSSESIHDRVVDLANRSIDRSEFLRLLAVELQQAFASAIVAIEASHWSHPMMLVADEILSTQVRRDSIRDLLRTAGSSPSTCDVPSMVAGRGGAGALRIELTPGPERAAVLLVYSVADPPPMQQRITDLQQLQLYGESTRSLSSQVPLAESELAQDSSTEQSDETPPNDDSLRIAANHRGSLRLFHLNLDQDETCYRIANESRRILDTDRVTILLPRGGRFRVRAVSGVSVVDARSNSIRALESLTKAATVLSAPLILPGHEGLPPQVQDPLDDYLDESDATSVVLLPLFADLDGDARASADDVDVGASDPFQSDGQIVAVMVLEYFSGRGATSISPTMREVASEATIALRNATELRHVFGLRLWKIIGRLVHSARRPLVMVSLFATAALLVASMLIQVDHYVIATGSIEPSVRRDVFATVDGVVQSLAVRDGQSVQAGDLLITLDNAELEKQAENLSGEIQTTLQRLSSLLAVRLSAAVDRSQSSRLALEEEQLESELVNLRSQQEIVQLQQDELRITSPIDGTVIAWQIERRLSSRPVARGNLLVSVADADGPWSLKLKIPDRDSGDVLKLLGEPGESTATPLAIQFAVATQPEASFSATLDGVGTAARLDELSEHVIDLHARIDLDGVGESAPFHPGQMRAGSDVTAKVFCGKRTLLRSWFGDVFDFAHRNILFYF